MQQSTKQYSTAHRECLGHQEYFLIELFLVFCKLIWSVPRPLGDSRKIKKNQKNKNWTSVSEIGTMWFLVWVEGGPWEKCEENKKYVKSNFKDSLLSSLLVILVKKVHFWTKKDIFLPKNGQKWIFCSKIAKSEESRLSFKFDFTDFLFSSNFSQGPPSTRTSSS